MRGYYVITLSAVTSATYSLRSQDFSSTFLPLTFLHLSVVSEALALVGKGEIFSLHPPYIISASLEKISLGMLG